jgi:hypothetical protein
MSILDAAVRGNEANSGRIVVGVGESLSSLQALRYAVAEAPTKDRSARGPRVALDARRRGFLRGPDRYGSGCGICDSAIVRSSHGWFAARYQRRVDLSRRRNRPKARRAGAKRRRPPGARRTNPALGERIVVQSCPVLHQERRVSGPPRSATPARPDAWGQTSAPDPTRGAADHRRRRNPNERRPLASASGA